MGVPGDRGPRLMRTLGYIPRAHSYAVTLHSVEYHRVREGPVAMESSTGGAMKAAVVFDNGSSRCKVGFAGDDAPQAVIPTLVGYDAQKLSETSNCPREAFVGHAAQVNRERLNLRQPIQRGIVTNWEDLEVLWHHAFYNDLKVDPSEHPVLQTDQPLSVKPSREKMTEIMFETFNTPAMYVAIQAVLALYASGRTTGIVLDSGDGVSHTVPIYEGYALPHAIQKTYLGGQDITAFMRKLLNDTIHFTTLPMDTKVACDIKEKLCYVAQDYERECELSAQSSCLEKTYTLPDGNEITVGNECFQVPEVMFKPHLIGSDSKGIHELMFRSIQKSSIDIQKDLYSNILLAGGNTMCSGLPERLQQEINSVAPGSTEVKIKAPSERAFSTWIGGSILMSLSTYHQMWITREEYSDYGPSIVHSKCY